MPAPNLKTIVESIMASPVLSVDRDSVELIVLKTIEGIGMHLNINGDVCDPRPNPTFMPPRQQNVHYLGNGRRRRSR